jgi:phosphatidylglycerol:prolipoprotein diacylglycerol transferase
VPLFRCVEQGGEILRGPVHLTQMYGVLVGLILIPILYWAFRRSRSSGFVFWQFVLWYSVLRSVIEEAFRDNPLYWNVYLSEGHRGDGKLRGCQGEGDTLEGKLFLDA